MKIAFLADIHSNIHALTAVLENIAQQDVDLVACLGDLVGYGAFPNQVIDTIRQRNILTVMGNYDDSVGNDRLVCGCAFKDDRAAELGLRSLLWTKTNTSKHNKRWLANLPWTIVLEYTNWKVRMVHGSPSSLNEYLFADTPVLNQVAANLAEDILVCGHTHLPYFRAVSEKWVLNAGSVGKPKHGRPTASYVILDLDDRVPRAEIVEVNYDYASAANEIVKAGLPAEFAEIIRTGKV
ncbi:MAG: metallophosphoesterase family protein [Firmicutes bacterium]|nr:metallophosphoesterase family protein [Bacillota bacterium]